MNPPTRKSIPHLVFDFFSSLGLATVLILLLGLLTWFATLEQVDFGLYPTLEKYFSYKKVFVFPELNGKTLPPLLGGYWTCALLLVNLTLGGIIRMRKGWKTAGVLMAHFGIIFMVAAGGVAQVFEERGVMVLNEGETADFAEDLTQTTIEIAEVKDGKITGPVHLVADKHYRDLELGSTRLVKLPDLPFDLMLNGYSQNGRPISANTMAPPNGEPICDGWFILSQKPNLETERDTPSLYAKIAGRDGVKSAPFILSSFSYQPLTIEQGGKTYIIRLSKRIHPVPFKVRLDKAIAVYHPNTNRPKAFESFITRLDGSAGAKVHIEMNKPMRHAGFTFFQRTMSPSQMKGPMAGGGKMNSGFEVVRNPSDKWPEYSLHIVWIGLAVHFLISLYHFAFKKTSKPSPAAP